jgi:hypothetical protein
LKPAAAAKCPAGSFVREPIPEISREMALEGRETAGIMNIRARLDRPQEQQKCT